VAGSHLHSLPEISARRRFLRSWSGLSRSRPGARHIGPPQAAGKAHKAPVHGAALPPAPGDWRQQQCHADGLTHIPTVLFGEKRGSITRNRRCTDIGFRRRQARRAGLSFLGVRVLVMALVTEGARAGASWRCFPCPSLRARAAASFRSCSQRVRVRPLRFGAEACFGEAPGKYLWHRLHRSIVTRALWVIGDAVGHPVAALIVGIILLLTSRSKVLACTWRLSSVRRGAGRRAARPG
jgi:hypothetical protein